MMQKIPKSQLRNMESNVFCWKVISVKERHCESIVAKTIREYGHIDVLVNNAATQYVEKSRARQPVEIATSYLFLASEDASYMTGQVLHPNGGEIING